MNLLIVVPSFKILGGVANHYLGLNDYWKSYVRYCTYGKRTKIPALFCLVPDIFVYIFKLMFCKIDVVILNPSLRNYQLKRDVIYFMLARLFGKKIITFFHGWDIHLAENLIENPSFFDKTYGKSNFIYVLCSDFKESLQRMKVTAPILLTTTKVKNSLLSNFDVHKKTGKINQILFLARIEESKGIFIALDCFNSLKKKYSYLRLSVCGSGTALSKAKEYVQAKEMKDVFFHGNIQGDKLISQFEESDIYILPTLEEGMATSVLEGMAFGLPIISRPVGGVKDFFVNSEMGYLTTSLDSEVYCELVEKYIQDPQKVRKTAQLNHDYAVKHFLASAVTKKFEEDIEKYCRN